MAAYLESYVIDGNDVALDLILWRRFKRPTPGLVEQCYDINKGLSFYGMLLPHNATVDIPAPSPAVPQITPTIRLW